MHLISWEEWPEEVMLERKEWHGAIRREVAEHRLQREKSGSYLLRQGERSVQFIQMHLRERYDRSIHCYVLTWVPAQHVIAERLLVEFQGKWTIYDDNPRLEEYTYHTLFEIIQEAGGSHPVPFIRH